MAEKKQESFTVTDRRLFTSEGEVRKEASEEQISTAPSPVQEKPARGAAEETSAEQANLHGLGADADVPPPPTAREQQEQADAYRESSKDMDHRVELSGRSAAELEMTFERFMASLYMTAMLQLGLMQEEGGQPRLDIVGARQTVDTLSLLAEKTKGNLTAAEQTFLQNCLYELRMAYVEVTNAISRPPKTAAGAPPPGTIIR
jgi:Domain of unknown function (DUF1844)